MYENILNSIVYFTESILKLGEATTFVHTPLLDEIYLQPQAEALFGGIIGTSAAGRLRMTKYMLGFFLMYPVGALFRLLPKNKILKNLFSLTMGILVQQFVFGADWIHPALTCSVCYFICFFGPRKYFASIVFFWMMLYLTCSHIYIMYTSYLSPDMDYTNVQMVVTMKMTSFAYNLYDGTVDAKNVFSDDHSESQRKLYQSRRRFAIQKIPDLADFFGYVYCFTCILAGPAFEYSDYAKALDDSCFEIPDDLIKNANEKSLKKYKNTAPSSFLPSLKKFAIAIFCMLVNLTISASYPIAVLSNETWLASRPAYLSFLIASITLIGERFKYFFAWKLAEASCIAAGFGFDGWTTNKSNDLIPKGWNGVSNVDILRFEFATTSQQVSKSWNQRTAGWLERYTYFRVPKSLGRGLALVLTYFISALWHGLYPGYFFFFWGAALMQYCEGLIRSTITPLICPDYNQKRDEPIGTTILSCPSTGNLLFWILSWVTTHGIFNVLVQPFSQRSFEMAIRTQNAYGWLPQKIMVLLTVVLLIVRSSGMIKKKSKSSNKKTN